MPVAPRLPLAIGLIAAAAAALLVTATVATAAPQSLPPIAGPTVMGGTASLVALRGKPVFINVWSSW